MAFSTATAEHGSKIKNHNLHEENWQLETGSALGELLRQISSSFGVLNVERNEKFQAVGYPADGHYGFRGDDSVTVQGYDAIATPLTPVPLPFR